MSAPFRRWINMRTLVQRAADCVADSHLPSVNSVAVSTVGRSRVSVLSHSVFARGKLRSDWTIKHVRLGIRASATRSTAASRLWTIATFSKVLLLLKNIITFSIFYLCDLLEDLLFSLTYLFIRYSASGGWLCFFSECDLFAAFIYKCGQHRNIK